jgi:serine/threonine protein kinase
VHDVAEEPASVSIADTPRSARDLVTASLSNEATVTPRGEFAEADSLVGRELGQFRVEARIGAGGLGVVYRAYDAKLKRPVAIKVLAYGRGRVDKLLAEARSAAALTHPSVATIYDVQQVSGLAFLVMELVPGCTLREELARGRLGASRVVAIAGQVAAAMDRAHRVGIVHRDLKPENVMITPDGAAKILDFGLARDVAAYPSGVVERSDTRPAPGDAPEAAPCMTGVVGTRHYLSPEQATGELADPRSDVFSFGVMLHEMVTGERPFESRAEPDPRRWGADAFTRVALPRAALRPMERVIDRCLELDPKKRFASGGEILAALPHIGSSRAYGVSRSALVVTALAMASLAAYETWHHTPGTSPKPSPSAAMAPRPVSVERRTFDAAGQTWEVVDGEWFRDGDALVGRSGHIQTTRDVSDAVLEVDVDFPDGKAATVGLGFRYSLTGDNPRAQCGYGVNFRPGPEIATFLGEDGDWGAIGDGYHRSPSLHEGKNHFVIRMAGTSFTVEANGQPAEAFTDARWPSGRVNFWVARTEGRFSNVRITPSSTVSPKR